MKYTLLPIKPIYVNEIDKGEKIFEFRKLLPNFKDEEILKKIIVYESSPTKAIVGDFDIEYVHIDTFEALMIKIDASESYRLRLLKYFGQRDICYAIKIKNFKKYDRQIKLEELKKIEPNFVAPQNYRFIHKHTDLFNLIETLKKIEE